MSAYKSTGRRPHTLGARSAVLGPATRGAAGPMTAMMRVTR
jgi:hypothetical protein